MAQATSNAEQRMENAKKAYHSGDPVTANRKFQNFIDDFCSIDEYSEFCFEVKLFKSKIARMKNKLGDAEVMLADLEQFVNDDLNGDVNKLTLVYAHNVFLAYQQSSLTGSEKWAQRVRIILGTEEVLTKLSQAWGYAAVGHHESMAGNYQEAISNYQKGIECADIINDLEKTGDLLIAIHNNLGIPYRRLGEPVKAKKHYQKSLEVIREVHGEKHLEVATAYNNIGTVYYSMQDIGQAAEYFGRAAGIIESILGPHHNRLGASLNNAGVSYYTLGDFERATYFLERAQRVKEENLGMEHLETAIGYSNLASIHIQNEDYSAAENNYLRSISVRKNIYKDAHPQLIEPKLRLGRLYAYHLDKPEEARTNYKKALEIGTNRLGETHPDVAEAFFLLGESYYNHHDYDEAQNFFRQSIEVLYGEYDLSESYDLDKSVSDPVKLIRVLNYKSNLYKKKSGNFDEHNYLTALHILNWAADLVDLLQVSFKNEASKLKLIDQNYTIYTGAIEILATLYGKTGEVNYNERIFEYLEKSRSRISLELIQRVSARTYSGVPGEVIDEETEINTQITRLQQHLYEVQNEGPDINSDLIVAYQDSVFRKKRELENFTRNLEELYPDYYALKYDQSVLSIQEAKNLLADEESIISYIFGEEKLFAFIITASESKIVELGFSEEVIRALGTVRDGVLSGSTKDYITSAHSLYEKLFEPIKPYLSGKKVLIMADQKLHYLPFEMLLTSMPKNENFHEMPYLLRDYAISYIPSATIFNSMNNRRPQNPRNLLAIAPFSSEIIRPDETALNVQYASSIGPLVLTKFETQTITGLFHERRTWREYFQPHKTELLIGSDATLKQFNEVNLKEYNFIHFATHAFIDENNPEHSGIMLYPDGEGSGVTFVGDIYNMEFNADLIVLGACDTGLGTTAKGEGLIGFTRAFIYAGASNLAVSMWKANDQPTAYLMIDFYDFIRDGYSYREALRKAKLNIINRPHFAHPVNWAAFTLIGR